MKKRVFTALIFATLHVSEYAGAQSIFKCVDANGRTTFSQQPCSDDAEKLDIKAPKSSGVSLGPQGDFSKMRADNAEREKQRKISSLRTEISDLERKRDAEVTRLRRLKSQATNNLAGANWEKSLSTEMKTVSENYNSQIDMKNKDIDRLRDEISALRSIK